MFNRVLRLRLLVGTVAGTLPLLSSPLMAQAAPVSPAPTDNAVPAPAPTDPGAASATPGTSSVLAAADEGDAEAIVVTGSRIRRPNLESTVPITSTGGEELFQTGTTSVGDLLNELPALRSTFNQSNSTRFLGTAGLSLLDLRGLGTQRTLVLVNGRRHVGADVLNNAVSPDVNTFPTDLIERVDVVTGGNSAIYGSDAIAGVVNFKLKDDFDGLQLRAQSGVSTYGDAGTYYISGLAGKNFADGRGNIAVNVEYARQDQTFAGGRPNLNQNDAFLVVDTDPAGSVNGSDGNPDRVFFRDIRSATISNVGNIRFSSGANLVNGPGGTQIANPNAGACGRDAAGVPFTCNFIFQPDGTLVPQTGTRVGIGPNGSFIGGNNPNQRTGNQFQILPEQDRYSINAIGQFEISPAFVPFFEAKYVRVDTLGSGSSGPAFYQGGTLDGFLERPRLDNPFLSPQARQQVTSQLQLANPQAVITDATRFSLQRNLVDLGVRQEQSRRETYRGVVGVRGDFADDFNYEASVNYGEFRERTQVLGNLNVQRFLLGLDAVRGPDGNIVCRSQIDPSAASEYVAGDPLGRLAGDVAACVPVNPFGQGNISQAARNYVLTDSTSVGSIKQLVVNGFVSGSSAKWFELPGGPIGFSVGAEYRRERVKFEADPVVAAGYTFYNALQPLDPPSFEVKEAFGELRLPIIRDVFLLNELTLSGALRVADYKGATGTVWAYNGGVDWSPVQGIRFRGNYSRAVRAPNLAELFSLPGQNFAGAPNDPCSARNIGSGPASRAANCAAAGRPAGYDFVYTSSLEIVSGGNPQLQAETSDSYTIGAVITPAFAPGLSITADYFDISVNDVITSPTAQQIIDACYDATDINNQFCGLFQRAGAGGGPNGEIPFQIIEGSLQQQTLNYARLKTRGIDAELSYQRQFDQFRLGTRLRYTHNFQNDEFLDPANPDRANQLLLELNYPQDEFVWDVNAGVGPFTLGYQMRYLGKMVVNLYEDFFSKQGRPPQDADYADLQFFPSQLYHDLRVAVDVNKQFNAYVGVDNLSNTLPPFGLTGVGGGSGVYNPRGRFFYAGVRANF